MKTGFWKITFASIVGVILASILMFIVGLLIFSAAASSGDEVVEIEDKTVLHFTVSKTIVDRASDNPLEGFNYTSFEPSNNQGLNVILKNIKKATDDPKIAGMFLDIKLLSAGMATTEEIRNALIDFKKAGKFIVSYADSYTQKGYYLASVSDHIYMNPEGLVDFTGMSASIMFYTRVMQKIGVQPIVIRHGKFKSAVEPFMLEKMSEANREQTLTYMGSLWKSLSKAIAEARGIDEQTLQQYADQLTIRSAKKAVEVKFIDQLMYRDEVYAKLRELTEVEKDKKIKVVSMGSYTKVPEIRNDDEKGLAKDKIAVIYASGEIGMGEGDESSIGSDGISKAIRKARKDKKVKAIVLRVNSPGGSALASEVIWREAVLAQKEKPFVVSMGDVAASGGYYIACAADAIVANPTTITGSIGVFGLLFNTEKLVKEYIGIDIDGVKTNKYADLANPNRPMTEEERAIIQQGVEDVYATFINHVAEGRKMNVADVDSIGQGRVWSGANAKEIGLIDEFGGLNKAIAIAAEKAKLDRYRVVEYPEKGKLIDELLKSLNSDNSDELVKANLGYMARYYDVFKSLQRMQGVQARLPYEIDIK